jgi:hypothetical protein
MGMKSKRTFFFHELGLFYFELLYLLEGGKGGEGAWKIVSRVGCTFFFLVGWKEIPLLPAMCVCCLASSCACHICICRYFFRYDLRYPMVWSVDVDRSAYVFVLFTPDMNEREEF